MKNHITVETLSKRLSLPQFTIRDYARKGILPAYKIGGRILFIEEEIEKAIKKNKM